MDKKTLLKNKADYIRNEVVKVSLRNKAGHIAPSLSSVDILVALYYECLSYNPKVPSWEDRDRLIFSKAHGCYALYAILTDIGVMPKREWEQFYTEESSLSGCMERRIEYGLEAGCGSLGHGLPIAVGVAFGAQWQGEGYHTFCIVGDGELQEGTTWEALQFAVKHKVRNITIIIDRNHIQAMDFIANVIDSERGDMIKRLQGFGLLPVICSGHDVAELTNCIHECKSSTDNKPKVIIAETVKGFGLKCMEGMSKFHFRLPACEKLTNG